MDRKFVIWAELCDRKYRIGHTDARNCTPVGVIPVTTVDECDLHLMDNYIRKKLARGWTPKMCRDSIEVQ